MNTLQNRFAQANKELKASLVGRAAECDLLFTGLLSKKNPLFVGPPGVAKSLMIDNLAKWIRLPVADVDCTFDYLLTKFTDPMELFGPINVEKLKQGQYERVVDGFIPTASLLFLDEVFKGSSAVLNTLLKVLNERVFKFGRQKVQCPILCAVAASNEYPNSENGGQELGALFDRFLIRQNVLPVRGNQLKQLLQRKARQDTFSARFSSTITPEEIEKASGEALALAISQEAFDAYWEILETLRSPANGIFPGNRRVVQSMDVAKAYAYLQGAGEVEVEHLEVLSHTLWDAPEQEKKCYGVVMSVANSLAQEVLKMQTDLEQSGEEAEDKYKKSTNATEKEGIARGMVEKLKLSLKELKNKKESDVVTSAMESLSEAKKGWEYRLFGMERD